MAKATTATAGSKTKQVTALREAEVLDNTSTLSLDSVTKNITSTQVEVQQSLATLSSKLTEQLQVLQNIEKSIELKQEEMRQLLDIEAKEVDLDQLQARIDETRLGWEKEQEQKKKLFIEQQSERNKQWAREQEEYGYKTTTERHKSEEEFNYKMALAERANKEKQAELEKTWSLRENELKKRENELVELRKQVESIPELVKKESNGAVAIATNSLKKEYETKVLLAAKDAEMAQKLSAQEVASLQATIAKLNAQIDSLKAQNDQAQRDVKEISAKALESASDRSAMAALQRVMEKEPAQRPSK
jgi:hypothetical protein